VFGIIKTKTDSTSRGTQREKDKIEVRIKRSRGQLLKYALNILVHCLNIFVTIINSPGKEDGRLS